jgi:glycosyltransferase involved in cell wall biosynthesis
MAVYRFLRERGAQVSIVSHGRRSDRGYRDRVPGIPVLCNWTGLSSERYERWIPWLHAPWLWRADLFKAEQIDGAEVALWSARRWRKPWIARCGYLHAELVEAREGRDSPQARWAEELTRRVFGGADHVVVTTPAMARSATDRFGVRPDRISVIPNYVDIALFRPDAAVVPRPRRVCSIGRLHEEKNYELLLRALAGTDIELLLVGSGPREQALRNLAAGLRVHVVFMGNRPSRELPDIIRSAAVFVLPSRTEGHPKALLEAMATGAAVVGTDVPGIREAIRHGDNGLLCASTPERLREAVFQLLGDAGMRVRLGTAARRRVESECSLERIADLELSVYRRVLERAAKEGRVAGA